MVGEFTYVDIGVFAILFIFFIIGIKKGFIDTILGLVGGLVSLVVAVLLASQVADLIYQPFGIGDSILGSVTGFLNNLLSFDATGSNAFIEPIGTEQNILLLVTDAIAKLGLPESFTTSISGSISTAITNAIAGSEAAVIAEKSLVEILSPILTRAIMLIIAVIITFIVIRIIVAIIESITKAILRTSRSLRSLNGLLGAIAGLAQGLLVVIIVFTIGFFVLSGTEPNTGNTDTKSEVATSLENSKVAKIIYDANPVPKLITDNINFQEIINGLLGINIIPSNTTPPPETA